METVVIIPARFASTRFPGKPLAKLNGKPIIEHVVEKASKCVNSVYVATDDKSIYEYVTNCGYNAVMTSTDHKSGTDRCFEAYCKIIENEKKEYDVIINIQGDEPFINPEQILTLQNCFCDKEIEIATLAKKFENSKEIFDPNKVKVICNIKQNAIYFSRFPLPFCRGEENDNWLESTPFFKHIGMYAYRPNILKQITTLAQSRLEKAESLEQLRWLENSFTIAVRETSHESIGIDTPQDLEEAERFIKALR